MLQYYHDKNYKEIKGALNVIILKVIEKSDSYEVVDHEEGDNDEEFDEEGVDVEKNDEEGDKEDDNYHVEPGIAPADDTARAREYE
mgnify:CR=1 FL=1